MSAGISDFYLNNFMAEFKGGARPNQFYADISVPLALKGVINNATLAEQKLRFFCRAASLPQSQIGVVSVPFRGRTFKVPGDREFAEWTVNITNDTDFMIRDMFEEWMDAIDGNVNHDQLGDDSIPTDFMSSGEVHQLNKNGDRLKSYLMVGIWPNLVGDIQLAYDDNNVVEVFPVTFQVQWWESNTTRNNTGADKFGGADGLILP